MNAVAVHAIYVNRLAKRRVRRGKVKLNPSALYLAVASLFSASKPRGSTDRAATDALPETDYSRKTAAPWRKWRRCGAVVCELAGIPPSRPRQAGPGGSDRRRRSGPLEGHAAGTRMLYGIVTNWAAFLLLPALFILHQFGRSVTDWDAVLGLLGTWLLFRVTLRGSCEAIRQAAEETHGSITPWSNTGRFISRLRPSSDPLRSGSNDRSRHDPALVLTWSVGIMYQLIQPHRFFGVIMPARLVLAVFGLVTTLAFVPQATAGESAERCPSTAPANARTARS